MQKRHKRMSRMLGYTLMSGDWESWANFAKVALHSLTDRERYSLSFAILYTLDPAQAEQTAAEILNAAGSPLPPFLGAMDDARHWASLASKTERKAYALAAFEAMEPADQNAFYRHIGEVPIQ